MKPKSAMLLLFMGVLLAGCSDETITGNTQPAEATKTAMPEFDEEAATAAIAKLVNSAKKDARKNEVTTSSMPDSFVVPKNTCEQGNALKSYSTATVPAAAEAKQSPALSTPKTAGDGERPANPR